MKNIKIVDKEHTEETHHRWISSINKKIYDGEYKEEQCYSCAYFAPVLGGLMADWGVCTNSLSIVDGRAVFEHAGCDKYSEAEKIWWDVIECKKVTPPPGFDTDS